MGPGEWRGIKCQVYQLIDQVGDKKSTYTFYVDANTKAPVHYEMFGYDTLLGSHFDKYLVDYYNFDESPIDPSIFSVAQSQIKITKPNDVC